MPNIDKNKLKTGMFIPHRYGRIEELKALFPGAIISLDTPPHKWGVIMGRYGAGLYPFQLASTRRARRPPLPLP